MRRLATWSPFMGLGLAALLLVGCGGGGSSGDDETTGDEYNEFVVRWTTPTNNQECNNDLSDPGLEGVITLNASVPLDPNAILDPTNAYNGLTSDLNILDSGFERVRGTPIITGDNGNVLTFLPQGGVLANGQYTVTVSRDVKALNGQLLNLGQFDYRTSFTVGQDIYKPKIRTTYPAPNQKDVDKTSDVIIIFNESLSPASVTTNTVTVMNGSANPPVPVNGTIKTARDNFEIIFTPDPANPMPANATIVVTVYGGANGVADVLGNTYEAPDPTAPGYPNYVFQFDTVKEPPPPQNPITVDVVNNDALIVYGTNTSIGTLREAPFIANMTNLSTWGTGNPIPNSERFIGQPGEIILDPRFGPGDSHTWMYIIDRASRSVAIVGTRDCRIVHRWRDLPDPRGLAIVPNGFTLFVTNYSADSLSFLDIGSVTPGAAAPTQQVKDLSRLKSNAAGNTGTRQDLVVGRGPVGAAQAPDAYLCFVANLIDNSCTLVDTSTMAVSTTFPVGTAPQDAAATFFFPGLGRFAFITCLGGGSDSNGSVSIYWSRPNGLQANITGFKNPKGCIYDRGAAAWIANSGGNTVAKLNLTVAGGGFAATILAAIAADITVGKNPTSCTLEPFSFFFNAPSRCVITADRGSSQISFVDAAAPSRPTYAIPIPGVQEVAAYFDQ